MSGLFDMLPYFDERRERREQEREWLFLRGEGEVEESLVSWARTREKENF